MKRRIGIEGYSMIISSLVCLLIGIVSCEECDIGLEQRNYGMLTTDEGIPLCPQILPWEVVCDDSCNDAEGDWFEPGLEWWNERIPDSFFSLGQDPVEFESRWISGWPGTLFVSVETLPAEIDWGGVVLEDEGGIAVLEWNDEGEIVSAWIRINHAYSYDVGTVWRAWIHELGHPLGLDDDMGIPGTVDLGSVMGSPNPYDGELLDSDLQLYQNTCLLDP